MCFASFAFVGRGPTSALGALPHGRRQLGGEDRETEKQNNAHDVAGIKGNNATHHFAGIEIHGHAEDDEEIHTDRRVISRSQSFQEIGPGGRQLNDRGDG